MNYLTQGNSETGPQVYLFNLPIKQTCRPTPWCKENCYGKKGYYIRFRRSIERALKKRYKLSLSDRFVGVISEEILRRKIKMVRVHVTGDFYSEEYVRKWIEIAENCPGTKFRTTTKRRDFKNVILKLHGLLNFNVRESLDPSFQKPIMDLPVAAIDTLNIAKNLFRCTQNCRKCGYPCWNEKNLSDCFPIINSGQFKNKNR